MRANNLKYEDGAIVVELGGKVDTDKDGIAAVEAGLVVKLNAYEALTEIAKKDLPFLKKFVEQKIEEKVEGQ